MRRFLRKYVPAALFLAASFALVVLVAVKAAGGAQAASHHSSKYYPPLMQYWQIAGPIKTDVNNVKYAIGLSYPGFLGAYYPSIGNKDIIPAMWTRLILPPGMNLMNSGNYKSRFSDSSYWALFHKRIPKTNLHWSFVNGVPIWKVLNVNGGVLPRVTFWVTGQPGQCFNATTRGMYYKKVKRGGRRARVLAPIPHAPVQTAQKCLPGTSPMTTTTSTATG